MDENQDNHKIAHTKKPKSSKKKNVLLVFAIIFTLFVVCFGVWYFVYGSKLLKNSDDNGPQYTPQEIAKQEALSKGLKDGQDLLDSGKKDAAIQSYDASIASTEDAYQKSQYIAAKAVVYFQDGDFSNALLVAQEAFRVDENHGVAGFIGQIYEAMGDKVNAISYYKKAIDLVSPSEPVRTIYIEDYKDRIKNLGGEV